ncbi:MAG: hypothetical protein EOP56_01540 [Sphingobacteriales bacterium]|nr:MAG: hypothetical protein EOP56_01540 [Sphingobacteriales bacterium]
MPYHTNITTTRLHPANPQNWQNLQPLHGSTAAAQHQHNGSTAPPQQQPSSSTTTALQQLYSTVRKGEAGTIPPPYRYRNYVSALQALPPPQNRV